MFDGNAASFALRYPFGRGGTAVVLTMVLSLLSFLVVPATFVVGYLVRLAGAAARAEQPPEYEDLGGLLVLGVAASVGLVGYAGAVAALVYAGLQVDVTLAGAFTVAGCYFAPASVTALAATGAVGPAAAVDGVLSFALTRHYLFRFVAYVLVVVIAGVVGLVALFFVPFGLLLAPLAAVPSAAYWGHAYGTALDEGVVDPLPADG
ncbi:DUF4013 domain-containing protein [Haloarchaeobius sp. HRN-SO-5]|uniref:DUF4013 domain-containing protein n=1 Tax=Haloarchaeobius sp. HRN-SO-5 TaxID=3446118 RepID=UPI003EBF6C47